MTVADLKPREMARWPVEKLAEWDEAASKRVAEAKALRALVDSALELRYADKARRVLFVKDQTSGTAHVDDGDFDVTVTFPKKINWKPQAFRKAIEKLQKKIADWHKYIAVEYQLPERNWSAMPEDLQQIFAEAREESVGKLRFTLSRKARPAEAA
jgi:hypothetical protein